MKPVDLVIAGGGFAGLACARTSALAGLRVVVLDPKPEAGARVRTTGIFTEETRAEAGLPPALTRALDGIRLYAPSLRSVDLDGRGYRFFATDTPAVLRWMANRAQSTGAELRWGEGYQRGARSNEFIHVGRETTRFLVGADGAHSRVARDFGLGRNRRFLFGVEEEWEGARGLDESRLHCFLTRTFAPGYIGWIVPGVGVTQIGLAGTAPFHPNLPGFRNHLGRLLDLSRARQVGYRAGWIPVGGPVAPSSAPGVMLIGDAAGQVSPLTAGGLRLALRQGASAGQAIAQHIKTFTPLSMPLSKGVPFIRKRLFRRILEQAFPDTLAEIVLPLALFQQWAAALFFTPRASAPNDDDGGHPSIGVLKISLPLPSCVKDDCPLDL